MAQRDSRSTMRRCVMQTSSGWCAGSMSCVHASTLFNRVRGRY
jgi:hypothetical protein